MSVERPWLGAGRCGTAGKARVWALAVVIVLGLPALGVTGSADSTEREHIDTERHAAESRFLRAQTDCQTRFIVTECLDAARAERRKTLDGLQKRQLVLDDARRRERAAERLAVQRARAAELAQAASAPLQQQARRPAAGASKPAPAAAKPDTSAKAAASAASAAATRQAQAAAAPRRRAAYDQRQKAAQAHLQALEARNARQDAIKAPAAGLPVPSASSAGR